MQCCYFRNAKVSVRPKLQLRKLYRKYAYVRLSAKSETLLLSTSTTPPRIPILKSSLFVRIRTLPSFNAPTNGAWWSNISKYPSIPGKITETASPVKAVLSGVIKSICMYCADCKAFFYLASARSFSPFAMASSIEPTRLKAASGR